MNLTRVTKALLCLIWISGSVYGLSYLWQYENAPGELGGASESWPPKSQLTNNDPSKPTLVMFLHPKCPCSRASVEELARLYRYVHGRVNIHILFRSPKTFSQQDVKESAIWQAAKDIPSLTHKIDENDFEISLFRPKTSGQVYLYDTNGNLQFSGGITAGRGHVGDNVGSSSIKNYVLYKKHPQVRAAIFGCSLFSELQRSVSSKDIKDAS